MYVYKYAAVDNNDRKVTGVVEALSEQEALNTLNRRQYRVLEILCKGQKNTLRNQLRHFWEFCFNRISDHTLVIFTRELSMMLKVGIPMDRAFHTLATYQENERMRGIVSSLREDILKGSSISHSVGKQSSTFPPIFRALVEVGEETGRLPEILQELAEYQEKELMTKKKVASALFYPCFVMISTVLIISLLMVYYVPTFARFLEGMQIKLPVATQFLLFIVKIFQNPGTITTMLIALVIAAYFYFNFTKTLIGRFFVDNVKISIPVLGKLFIMIGMTRFARTFALMYKSGIQIERIIDSTKDVVQIEPLRDIFDQIKMEVMSGESVSSAFSSKKYITPLVKSFLALGEETENIAFSMEKIAEMYDEQIALRIDNFISMLEPVFMALVAMIVGFVIIALFLPIYSMISNIGS
ncbi:MAG: type II secretion system F family protein [Candidatus Xenobiia bacterium LiM19]